MSLSGKYTPLNLNALGSFIHNEGLTINANTLRTVGRYYGTDLVTGTYMPGTLLGNTVTTSTNGDSNSVNTPPSPVTTSGPGAATLTVLSATGASTQSVSYFKLTGFPNEKVSFRIDYMTNGSIFPHVSINISTGDVDLTNSTGWTIVTLDGTGTYTWTNPLPGAGTYYATAVWGQYLLENVNIRPNLPVITTAGDNRFWTYLGVWNAITNTNKIKLNQPVIIDGISSDGTHTNTATSTSTTAAHVTPQTVVSTTYNFIGKLPKIFALAFERTYPTIDAVDMVQGSRYMIQSLGVDAVSDFTIYGAKSNKLGTEFISTGAGGGDGTLYDMSDAGSIKIATYKKLITMGQGVCELLGNSAPASYTRSIPILESRFGFLGQFALQAYKEFYINNGSYSDFFNTFNTCISIKNQNNKVIDSFVAGPKFLDGIYSTMNDLVTGDITGVNLSTHFWGQDLIASGRAIDLANIDKFGNPDTLLKTLFKFKAITKALNLALLASGLNASDITNITNGANASSVQQKQLYGAFNLILGVDLVEVLIPINCQIKGLNTLADLLNPKKLFPNSYQSLTFPTYNTKKLPTNSKTYYLLYKGADVDILPSTTYGSRLINFLPSDVAYACDAFSLSMTQIKNIKSMDIEKFSQVVSNMEHVSDLNVNGTSIPTNTDVTNRALAAVANGSGANGKYTTGDFFGCMTDFYPLTDLDKSLKDINSADLSALTNTYDSMYTLVNTSNPSDGSLSTLITQANAAIKALYTNVANTGNLNSAPTITPGTPGLFILSATAKVDESKALVQLTGVAGEPVDIYIFYDNPRPSIIAHLPIQNGQVASSDIMQLQNASTRVNIGSDGTYTLTTSLPLTGTYWIMACWVTITRTGGGSPNPVAIATTPADYFFNLLSPELQLIATKTNLNKPIIVGGQPSNGETINYVVDTPVNSTGAKTTVASPAYNLIDKATSIYNKLATSLQIEQNARDLAFPNGTDNLKTSVQEVYGFIDNLSNYALDIENYQTSNTLENISDLTNIGGSSLVGSLREIRNAHRMNLIGGELDNDVEIATLNLPSLPGTTAKLNVLVNDGLNTSTTTIDSIIISGVSTTPGSLGGSPYSTLIPNNLNIINLNNSNLNVPIIAPSNAINDVTLCNCDCWELLKK